MHGVNGLLEGSLETELHEVARETHSWATSFDILVGFFVEFGINFLGIPSSEREYIVFVFDLLGYESVVLALNFFPSDSQVTNIRGSLICLKVLFSCIILENWSSKTFFFKNTGCCTD